MLIQIAASLTGLLPALVAIVGLRIASHREGPFPTETAVGIAYREGRQCANGVGWTVYSPPERCAHPEGHYGECAP